jgi:hypothetical protein
LNIERRPSIATQYPTPHKHIPINPSLSSSTVEESEQKELADEATTLQEEATPFSIDNDSIPTSQQ